MEANLGENFGRGRRRGGSIEWSVLEICSIESKYCGILVQLYLRRFLPIQKDIGVIWKLPAQ